MFERALAKALLSEAPLQALRALASAPELPQEVRAQLAAVDEDGVRMTALLLARLRFERLMQACPLAAKLFSEDPEGFTELFRAYHHAVLPEGFFPAAEATAFEDWFAQRAR